MIDSRYRARIGAIHEALCIPADYEARACLPLYEEAQELADAGQDCFGREQCMTPATLVAWQALQVAAQSDGVELLLVSAYLPGHIKARVKNPMLMALKTWALAHLLVNGDLASMLLFGAFLAWGVVDLVAVKRSGRSSVVAEPLVAYDVVAVVIGLGIYALIVTRLHVYIAGVPIVAS